MAAIGLGYIPDRTVETAEQQSALAELVNTSVPFSAPAGPIPDAVDHRGWLTGANGGSSFVRNQGPRPSCCGNMLSNAGFLLNAIDTGARGRPMRTLMSALYCWRRAQYHCGLSGETGATISGAVRAAKQDGFPREITLPYDPTPNRPTTIPPEATAEGRQHPLIGMATNVKGQWDQIIQGIGTGSGVVMIGTRWTGSLSGCRSTGGFVTSIGGQFYGYHATLIVGYSRERGETWLHVLNSHGSGYGDRGFFYLNRASFSALANDPNAEMWLVSDMAEYGAVRDLGWATGMRFG